MIQEIIKRWEENKYKLEEYFSTTKQEKFASYEAIVQKIFELVINSDEDSYERFNINKMTVIDDGYYQGTQIFIIPKDTYQPNIDDYLITHTYYGSCSGCDVIEGIRNYSSGLPTEQQVKEYMILALHLVQKMKRITDD
mgnify:CR=1 FL=1